MKIEEIINLVCNHEISKLDAISEINKLVDGLRQKNALEFKVESVGFSIENNDGYLTLRLPYGYNKIKEKVNKGDIVDIIFFNS